jgi:hypothetical protein
MRRLVSSPTKRFFLFAAALGLGLVMAPAAVTGAGAAVGTSGSLVLWNRFEHQTDPLRSEVGPDVQLTSYLVSSWEQARIVPGRFGNGLFVNQGTDEGWNGWDHGSYDKRFFLSPVVPAPVGASVLMPV